jgi:hypothetical protein
MKDSFEKSRDEFKKLETKCKLYKGTVERLQKDKKKTKDKLTKAEKLNEQNELIVKNLSTI